MAPPSPNSIQKRSPSNMKQTTKAAHSVRFDLSSTTVPPVNATSHHAGCHGMHHTHSHHRHPTVSPPPTPPAPTRRGESSAGMSKSSTGAKRDSGAEKRVVVSTASASVAKSHHNNTHTGPILKNRKAPNSTKVASRNNNTVSSTQQCCSSLLSGHDQASSATRVPTRTRTTSDVLVQPINGLRDKTMLHIFSFLNHTDLLQCRAVQKRWNSLLTRDKSFLDNTVYVINIQRTYNNETDTTSYNDLLLWASLPFQHARFQYVDHPFFKEPQYFNLRNSDNERYMPNAGFLRNLTSLEFRNCYLLWSTLKQIFAKCSSLDKLVIDKCFLSDAVYDSEALDEFAEFTAGNTVFGLKTVEIHENRYLSNINKFLSKLTGYSNQSITHFKISYHPPAEREIRDDIAVDRYDFCREVKSLVTLNAKTLTSFALDIQDERTLDMVGYHLTKELEALGDVLDLTEFSLSPALGIWLQKPQYVPQKSIALTLNTLGEDIDVSKMMKVVAASLARFLELQPNLRRLGLPCLEYPEAYSACFRNVLQRLPCGPHLEHLTVPCAGFLPEDFLDKFRNLKELRMGASCCSDITSCWDVFRQYNGGEQIGSPRDSQLRMMFSPQSDEFIVLKEHQEIVAFMRDQSQSAGINAQQGMLMQNIKELSVTTIECPEKFALFARNLPNLTRLEVDSGLETVIFRDNDLQACIKYLKMLQSLKISCCRELTDFAITGIPSRRCMLMFKHQRYYKIQEPFSNPILEVREADNGRPLSDLRGLRELVLLGECDFTDIGIAFGLGFKELKMCYLPYSSMITSWGIAKLGSSSPSLETLVLFGVNPQTKDDFAKLKRTHERLRKGDISRSGFLTLQQSYYVGNYFDILPTPREILDLLIYFFIHNVHPILAATKPPQSARNLEILSESQ